MSVLPHIVTLQMLRSEDPGVHYEAVGVIGNLVHSSTEIKQRVLEVRGCCCTCTSYLNLTSTRL